MDFDLLDLFGGTALGGNLFGAPGVGQLYDQMPVPGMPQTGGPPPGGLLGGNPLADMPAAGAAQNAYIIPSTGQQVAAGTTTAAAPPPAPLLPPKPVTVARDPDAANPVLGGSGRIPNQGGGPDERTAAPPPIVPPKI
ncbi:MAG: hypothetical protein ABWX62_09210, partial [Microterricola sp.]